MNDIKRQKLIDLLIEFTEKVVRKEDATPAELEALAGIANALVRC